MEQDESMGVSSPADPQIPRDPGPEEKILQSMDYWASVPWDALHDPIRTFDCVPPVVRAPLAELRGSIAEAAIAKLATSDDDTYLKAFFFLDRLIFAASRSRRGGARGQKGETISKTIARRIRLAWSGSWGVLWVESQSAVRSGAGLEVTEAQQLARDLRSVEEALADDDLREALRSVDNKMRMASDAKTRRCLPALFPQAPAQPDIERREPLPDDVVRFRQALRRAYQHAPRHRSAGPGGARNEHWSWMPRLEESWAPVEELVLRFQLSRLPYRVMQALMSARVLAGDCEEHDKVRPLALGNIHKRLASKAAGRIFQARVAAVVAPVEYSLGVKGGAELMHKTVLVDLDSRGQVAKLSFDVTNAYNEYDRAYVANCVKQNVPDFLPWVQASLSVASQHIHVGSDSARTTVSKTRGGDPGDALTSLLFPLAYKEVAADVQQAALRSDPHSRTYTYQDDMEVICTLDAIEVTGEAYNTGCKKAGLRANMAKLKATLGRGADHSGLPARITVDPRAVVLRHGPGGPVSAMPSQQHAEGSQIAEGADEVRGVIEKRAAFYQRLTKLRGAGLQPLTAMALLRARTAGDYTFVARACGVPANDARRMDSELVVEINAVLGQGAVVATNNVAGRRTFAQAHDGGMGFQSVERLSPIAYAASWHAAMPKILARLGVASSSALTTLSPWAASCLPAATLVLRSALGDHSINIGDEGVEASQHVLAQAPNDAAARALRDEVSVDLRAAAALRSSGGRGAGGWTNAPTIPNQHMAQAQYTIAFLTRLHLPLPHCAGQCQHRRADGTLCGKDLDAYGIHARMCSAGGWSIRRHDAVCAVLAEWCEDMGCLLQQGQKPWGEVMVPWAAPARLEARMDLVIHAPGVAAPVYVDVTIVSPHSKDATAAGAAIRDGVAGEIAARGKLKDYPLCSVVPFVIEDHGRLSDHALQLIRMIAPTDPVERSTAIRRVHQSIGATVQRCSADAVLAATAVVRRR